MIGQLRKLFIRGVAVVLDDDEYQDDEPSTSEGGPPIPDSAHQSAIDITAEWIYERLNPKLVANLVLISLVGECGVLPVIIFLSLILHNSITDSAFRIPLPHVRLIHVHFR